ncbi:hypothetical protein ASE42_10170 [Bacillus sp. Root920]|nr:hypothetical protein ASE42_10170 [Bacillus sp. Root920]
MEMFDEKGLEYFFAACKDEFILLIPHLLMIRLSVIHQSEVLSVNLPQKVKGCIKLMANK